MHQRLAVALVEVGRSNPANVDPLEVGMHFVASGDAVRAVALLQHAAEVALIRHAPHDAAVALKGLSDALGVGGPGATQRRIESLARASALALSAHDPGGARAHVDEARALAAEAKVDSPELWLVQARVLRSEARRARAAEALARADGEAVAALASLVSVERGESYEQEGDSMKAMVAFEAALACAEASRALARWHGEIDLVARIEARLGALSLQKKDVVSACKLFESSAARWRAVQYPAGEARALSNLAAACAAAKDLAAAVKYFGAAAEAAARSGDLLFQTRALLQLARAQKKLEPNGTSSKATAIDARRLALALGWEQGRLEANALIDG
jgi:tetratricopeptide (TPR) repeat protein